jgi:hypothetical protein
VSVRKKRPVLYEVVSRSRKARPRAAERRVPPAPQRLEPPPAEAPRPQPKPAPAPSSPPTQRRPSVQFASGELRLVLGAPQMVIAGFLIVVVIGAAFWIGQQSMRPPTEGDNLDIFEPANPDVDPNDTANPIEMPTPGGGERPVATPLTPDPAPSAAESEAPRVQPQREPVVAQFRFEPDAYYVIVQHFRSSRRDHALAAGQFLRSKGIPTVVRSGNGDWELVVAQPFERAGQTGDLVRRLKLVGQEYLKAGGGYAFHEPQVRKF